MCFFFLGHTCFGGIPGLLGRKRSLLFFFFFLNGRTSLSTEAAEEGGRVSVYVGVCTHTENPSLLIYSSSTDFL